MECPRHARDVQPCSWLHQDSCCGVTLTLIAAMDAHRLLAGDSGIPWHLPWDIAHFRASTQDKWLLLGRRTFGEMRGWFREGHMPLVLSSQCGWDPDIGRVVSSVPHALALAESAGQHQLVCCGGAQTYAAALPYADLLVLTVVHHRFTAGTGGVFFPLFDESSWREIESTPVPTDEKHAFAFTIRILEKR